ncbi:hypothetical protein QFC21_003918 [Naganishia friedmannii]|uniref:Uncharacterized protein n=1 Tax=Naganishia friedmannii TaxID=89922 RepID=A0ACC2VL73_9TREE|nr:hypothetical protein QFC21_003918 [Naganishia friedmannii]
MAPRMPHVYLVRHGQTEWSLNGRHTGTSDIPLTEKGVEIMKRTAKKVVPGVIEPKNVSHVFVSPRKRAQTTADLLFNHDDKNKFKSFETEDDVAEWDYGAYEGLKTHEIRETKPDWDIWTDGCPPGDKYPGESPQQMSDRVDRVIAKIRAIHKECLERPDRDGTGQDIVIVSHGKVYRGLSCPDQIIYAPYPPLGHFSRAFVARWCDLPLNTGYHFVVDPGALHVLGYQHNTMKEPSLIGLNWYTEERC